MRFYIFLFLFLSNHGLARSYDNKYLTLRARKDFYLNDMKRLNPIGPNEIVPGLFLGSADDATRFIKDIKKSEKQRFIFNVAGEAVLDRAEMGSASVAITELIDVHTNSLDKVATQALISLSDHPVKEIYTTWHDSSDFKLYNIDFLSQLIHIARENEIPVFVHCQMGVSRSVALVIHYLIKYGNEGAGMSFKEAFDLVRLNRPIIDPNYGFRAQLGDTDPDVLSALSVPKLMWYPQSKEADQILTQKGEGLEPNRQGNDF